jgi:hypothetical protein
MNLYLITLISNDANPKYDVTLGMVIRAEGPTKCRNIAKDYNGDEGKEAWTNPNKSKIAVLAFDVHGKAGLVLRDFNAS